MAKLWSLRRASHVIKLGETRKVQRILNGKPLGKHSFECSKGSGRLQIHKSYGYRL
jgi:hypothetical protein